MGEVTGKQGGHWAVAGGIGGHGAAHVCPGFGEGAGFAGGRDLVLGWGCIRRSVVVHEASHAVGDIWGYRAVYDK